MNEFTLDDAQRVLDTGMAPWLGGLGMVVEELTENGAVVRLPWHERISRGGGLVAGQTLLAFADAAMAIVISSAIGGFRNMATVDMTTSFLAPARNVDIIARGEVLRRGKRMVFGRIDLENAGTREPVALIQTTWTLLE